VLVVRRLPVAAAAAFVLAGVAAVSAVCRWAVGAPTAFPSVCGGGSVLVVRRLPVAAAAAFVLAGVGAVWAVCRSAVGAAAALVFAGVRRFELLGAGSDVDVGVRGGWVGLAAVASLGGMALVFQ